MKKIICFLSVFAILLGSFFCSSCKKKEKPVETLEVHAMEIPAALSTPYLPKGTHKTLDVMSFILRNKPKIDVWIFFFFSAILQ